MNRRMVFYMLGKIVFLEAALLTLPMIVSFLYRESCAWSFLITIGVAVSVGFLLTLVSRPGNKFIYAKEGFVIVALSWITLSAIGALPFVLCGDIPSYVDAFFETVSGFTTTGASILRDVESLNHGTLFWRSFTHWIGGMGILVLIMAIIPTDSGRSMHILRAEMPGPIVDKLVPKVKDTAKILYLIYIVMTAVQMVFLLFGGLSLFESAVYAFGTAGTGGFAIKADGMASCSPYVQWVITIFMLLFGINFNIYYLILIKRFKSAVKSTEMWCYLGIIAVSVAAITLNILSLCRNFAEAFRLSSFQVVSIITTTGYSTTDFNLWPSFSKAVLLLLMFIGGCAGSTAGGLKVSRVVLLFKMIKRGILKMIHPRSVSSVKFEGRTVDDATARGIGVYFAIYMGLCAVVFLALSFEPFDFETNFTAMATCVNNVGPGFGAVGPASSFALYSPISKIILSVAMLLGRLEIYPILLTLIPSVWVKK